MDRGADITKLKWSRNKSVLDSVVSQDFARETPSPCATPAGKSWDRGG